MVHIEEKKRVDWNAIRAEYIGGGIGQRKLAEKHGVTYSALRNKADIEEWVKLRAEAKQKSGAKAAQKTADAAANNAIIAEEIKHSLLVRLKRIEKKYPIDATEVRTRQGNNTAIFRIRDLTAAYKDLTEDMTAAVTQTNDLLQSLMDLERKAESGAEA